MQCLGQDKRSKKAGNHTGGRCCFAASWEATVDEASFVLTIFQSVKGSLFLNLHSRSSYNSRHIIDQDLSLGYSRSYSTSVRVVSLVHQEGEESLHSPVPQPNRIHPCSSQSLGDFELSPRAHRTVAPLNLQGLEGVSFA